MKSTVDLTLSRRVFYRTIKTPLRSPCPRCGTTLSPEAGLYFVATRKDGRQRDDFMISGGFGFYCSTCPTVVIDPQVAVVIPRVSVHFNLLKLDLRIGVRALVYLINKSEDSGRGTILGSEIDTSSERVTITDSGQCLKKWTFTLPMSPCPQGGMSLSPTRMGLP